MENEATNIVISIDSSLSLLQSFRGHKKKGYFIYGSKTYIEYVKTSDPYGVCDNFFVFKSEDGTKITGYIEEEYTPFIANDGTELVGYIKKCGSNTITLTLV